MRAVSAEFIHVGNNDEEQWSAIKVFLTADDELTVIAIGYGIECVKARFIQISALGESPDGSWLSVR